MYMYVCILHSNYLAHTRSSSVDIQSTSRFNVHSLELECVDDKPLWIEFSTRYNENDELLSFLTIKSSI